MPGYKLKYFWGNWAMAKAMQIEILAECEARSTAGETGGMAWLMRARRERRQNLIVASQPTSRWPAEWLAS